jgi:hypothetical protein
MPFAEATMPRGDGAITNLGDQHLIQEGEEAVKLFRGDIGKARSRIMPMARGLLAARRKYPANVEFNRWLQASPYNDLGKTDRASLIKLAEHENVAERFLRSTDLVSPELIWQKVAQQLPFSDDRTTTGNRAAEQQTDAAVKRAFDRAIDGSSHTGWHNSLPELFGAQPISNEPTPAQRIWELTKALPDTPDRPVEIATLILAMSTLLPQDRHALGDGEPKRYGLFLQTVFEHEKEHGVLNDLHRRPERHRKREYIERLIERAYVDYRRARAETTVVSEVSEAAEAADEEAA